MQFGNQHGLVAVTLFLFFFLVLWVTLKPQVKLVTELCKAEQKKTFSRLGLKKHSQPSQLPAAPQLFGRDIYGLNLTHSNLPGKGESLTGS